MDRKSFYMLNKHILIRHNIRIAKGEVNNIDFVIMARGCEIFRLWKFCQIVIKESKQLQNWSSCGMFLVGSGSATITMTVIN